MTTSRQYIVKVRSAIKHIVLSFCCLLAVEAMAQIPWTVQMNGPSQVLVIPPIWNIQVDSSLAIEGDALGVFVSDTSGFEICVGAVLVSDSVEYLTVYGQDSLSLGLSPGEVLQFKLYNQLDECELFDLTVLGDSGNVFFTPGDTTNITFISAASTSINYPISETCHDDELFLNSDEFVPATYISSWGLEVDSLTGTIDVDQSLPGNYTLFIFSDFCLIDDSIPISIYAIPTVTIIGDTINACQSENVSLSVQTDGSSVFWSNGDSTLNTSYLSPATGFVSVVNNDGCSAIDSFELILNESFFISNDIVEMAPSLCQDSTELTFDVTDLPLSTYTVILDSDTLGTTTNVLNALVKSGFYYVAILNEAGCRDSISLIVQDERIDTSNINFDITHPTCEDAGRIEAFLGITPLDIIITNEDPSSLEPGTYAFSIEPDASCVIDWPKSIILNPRQGCQSEVMYPETDGAEATFYIPIAGSTNIIDRNGQVIRTLQTPAQWDGRDDNNELVPMGEYYIITNESSSITISVIR